MPRPFAYTKVFAVPRSMARSPRATAHGTRNAKAKQNRPRLRLAAPVPDPTVPGWGHEGDRTRPERIDSLGIGDSIWSRRGGGWTTGRRPVQRRRQRSGLPAPRRRRGARRPRRLRRSADEGLATPRTASLAASLGVGFNRLAGCERTGPLACRTLLRTDPAFSATPCMVPRPSSQCLG